MKTFTNLLKYKINRENINKDFFVVCFENEKDFKKVNSQLLDCPDINIRSMSYTSGKFAYALMDKNAFEDLRFCETLENIKYTKMDIYSVFDDLLIRLFLNSLSNYNLTLAYNNITGKFYKLIEYSKDKIKALNFYVKKLNYNSDEIIINVSSTTFKHTNKIYNGEPTYVLSGNNKSLTRVFSINKQHMYVKGNDKNSNASFKFLDFKDGSGKALELIKLVELFNENFSNYIKIELKEIEINKKIEHRRLKLQNETLTILKNYEVNVCNLITDPLYKDQINNFVSDLRKIGIKTSKNKELSDNKLNIVLIYDKEYYKNEKIDDMYKYYKEKNHKKCVTQHIVIDNLKVMFVDEDNKPSPQLITVLKELLIKRDIVFGSNSFSYDNWSDYKFSSKYTFIYKDKDVNLNKDNLFKMSVLPDGKYKIEKEEINLFNSYENYKYIDLFVKNANVKMLIIDDKGNVNSVEKTDIITLPSVKLFNNCKISKSKKLSDELYSGLCGINYYEIDGKYYYNVGQTLSNIQFQILRASHFYKINCIDNSECIIPNLLELMSVSFVKYNENTVLPYPIKYLKEYIEIYR